MLTPLHARHGRFTDHDTSPQANLLPRSHNTPLGGKPPRTIDGSHAKPNYSDAHCVFFCAARQMFMRKNNIQDDPLPSQREATHCEHLAGKKRPNEHSVTTTAERSSLCDKVWEYSNASQLMGRLELSDTVWNTRGGSPSLYGGEEPSAGVAAQGQEDVCASMASALAPQHDWCRCQYSTGHSCNSMRKVKTTGELHRLCKLHANQAKLNQRNSVQRKRDKRSVRNTTTHPLPSVARDLQMSRGMASFAQQGVHSDACRQQATGVDAGLNISELQMIDTSQPDLVYDRLVALGLQDLAVEADEDSPSDETSSEGPADSAWDLIGDIPPNDPLRVLMDDVSDGEISALLAESPWLLEFIDEAYESLRTEM